MLTPAMLRILRWLDEYPTTLESAWDVPRSISLEGIADGIGVVRSALFQPMSALEQEGLIQTRQAHVLGSGRRKRRKWSTLQKRDADDFCRIQKLFLSVPQENH